MFGQKQSPVLPINGSRTPFTCQPLLGEFGYLAVGENAQKELKEEYDPPPNTDVYAKIIPFYA